MIQGIQAEKSAVTAKEAEIMTEIEVKENEKLKELSSLYKNNPAVGKKRMMEFYGKEEITLAYIDEVLKIKKKK